MRVEFSRLCLGGLLSSPCEWSSSAPSSSTRSCEYCASLAPSVANSRHTHRSALALPRPPSSVGCSLLLVWIAEIAVARMRGGPDLARTCA
eukprot:13548196-Alexandrium_andersonii.AAC.1